MIRKFGYEIKDIDDISLELEPITVEDVKSFINIDNNNVDNNLISELITAFREYAEKYIRQSLVSRRKQISYPCSDDPIISLFYGPFNSIEYINVSYDNTSESIVDQYRFDKINGLLSIDKKLPSFSIDVIYNAGFEKIPKDMKYSLLVGTSSLYKYRYNDNKSTDIKYLLKKYTKFKI